MCNSLIDELELRPFLRTMVRRIEDQELDIVFDPLFGRVCGRVEYERNRGLVEWECAICGDRILTDRRRNDVENFVCERCREAHNNTNQVIDRRILDSRTRMFKMIEDTIYDELETRLNRN